MTADSAVLDAPADKKVEDKPADKKVEDKPVVEDKKTTTLTDDKPVDKKAEDKPASVVPEKYELKLPDKSILDPAITERTGAIARTLGLSNEAAQKALDFVGSEVAAREAVYLAAHKPGGEVWVEKVEEWETAAKADPEIGGVKFEASVAVAKQTLSKYFPDSIKKFLGDTGMGSNPDVIRALVKIAKATGEDKLVTVGTQDSGKETLANKFYPSSTKKE